MILKIVDDKGVEREIPGQVKSTLMEMLRDHDYVPAICGGMCSCATCHVYIDPAWFDKLPALQSDEGDLLSELSTRKANSRLSCQILLKPEYDGLRLTVAPEE